MVDLGVSIGAVALLKEIGTLVKGKKGHSPELIEKIYDLHSAMSDLIAENAELTRKVAKLEEQNQLYEGLSFDSNWGVWREEDGQPLLHYCTKCITSGHRVPLQEGERGFRCGNCDSWFEKPETRPKPVKRKMPRRTSINPWVDY